MIPLGWNSCSGQPSPGAGAACRRQADAGVWAALGGGKVSPPMAQVVTRVRIHQLCTENGCNFLYFNYSSRKRMNICLYSVFVPTAKERHWDINYRKTWRADSSQRLKQHTSVALVIDQKPPSMRKTFSSHPFPFAPSAYFSLLRTSDALFVFPIFLSFSPIGCEARDLILFCFVPLAPRAAPSP